MTPQPFLPLILILMLGAISSLHAACPSTPTVNRFSFNANGSEVTDSKTGLVWARCSAGQSWSGSGCVGAAAMHAHEQALQLAQDASGWRLPNVKELASIADKGCQSPAIDVSAFPGNVQQVYWTSSPTAGVNGHYVWTVGFTLGGVGFTNRSYLGAIRLIREDP